MSKTPNLPTLHVSIFRIKRRVKQLLKSAAYNTHICRSYVHRYIDKYLDYIDLTDCINKIT
jgi:hypothetical protein